MPDRQDKTPMTRRTPMRDDSGRDFARAPEPILPRRGRKPRASRPRLNWDRLEDRCLLSGDQLEVASTMPQAPIAGTAYQVTVNAKSGAFLDPSFTDTILFSS